MWDVDAALDGGLVCHNECLRGTEQMVSAVGKSSGIREIKIPGYRTNVMPEAGQRRLTLTFGHEERASDSDVCFP